MVTKQTLTFLANGGLKSRPKADIKDNKKPLHEVVCRSTSWKVLRLNPYLTRTAGELGIDPGILLRFKNCESISITMAL